MDGSFTVYVTPQHIAAQWQGPQFLERGVAEASFVLHPDQGALWYVNRVLVQGTRSRGVGGRLLEMLKSSVAAQAGTVMVVEPGGYGSDLGRLEKFYGSHGFVREPQGWMACSIAPNEDL